MDLNSIRQSLSGPITFRPTEAKLVQSVSLAHLMPAVKCYLIGETKIIASYG